MGLGYSEGNIFPMRNFDLEKKYTIRFHDITAFPVPGLLT